MPAKATTKAAAPKKATAATATKKTATTTAKSAAKSTKAAAPKKTTSTSTTSKPTTNGTTAASRKRKAEDDDVADSAEDAPKAKKAKQTAAPKKAAAPAKSTTKKTTTKSTTTKKATTKKAATKQATAPAKARKATVEPEEVTEPEEVAEPEESKVNGRKRKSETPVETKKPTRAKKIAEPVPKRHPHQIGAKINEVPTDILDVYVFGEGSSGELGLGSKRVDGKKPMDVKRPRLNNNLAAGSTGIVQLACGGMHVAALTKDNVILTWGVNDQGALGRDTNWDGGLRDVDQESDSGSDDEDDSGLNPQESTPKPVSAEYFAPDAKFVQLVASDSATFALTEDGRVYGWGTFRSSDGILGFDQTTQVQYTPHFMKELKNIKALAAGSNHILALDKKGIILAWGCGQQNQLGRRIIERNKMTSLIPQGMGLPKKNIAKIACGQYHSFAVDTAGKVWAWGLNNFAETGIREGAGEDDAIILRPTIVESLADYNIADIAGGQHHSLACSEEGELLTWGRFDGHQAGVSEKDVDNDNLIRDEGNNARILAVPTVVKAVTKVTRVAAGTDNNFAVTSEGTAYSWGFSTNYQTGQGTIDDIEVPTLIDNTAVRGKKLIAAGAGGQFSILLGLSATAKVNGAGSESSK